MKNILVCSFNILLVIPMFVYVIIGIILKFTGEKIEDSFTYYINPMRDSMYGWAYKKDKK